MKHLTKTSIIITSFIIAAIVAIFQSCNKDERNVTPVISNEGLTTAYLELENTSDASDKPFAQWEQLLDASGNPLPVDVSKATLKLKSEATYKATITLLDKSQSPVFVVTDEVRERSVYHLFFYQTLPTDKPLVIPNDYPTNKDDLYPQPIPTPIPAAAALDLTVTITDHDAGSPSLPLGIETKFVAGAPGSGWLRIVLRHQPEGKDGTYAPGSTDLDVGFNVVIQ